MHGGAHTYLLLGMPWSAVAAYNEYPLLHLDRSDQEGHQLQLLVGYLLECVCDGKSVHSSSGVACGVCNSAGDSVGAVHSSSHPHAVDRFSTNRAPHLQTPPALRCLSSNTTACSSRRAFVHATRQPSRARPLHQNRPTVCQFRRCRTPSSASYTNRAVARHLLCCPSPMLPNMIALSFP